jgi:hypothetical protein
MVHSPLDLHRDLVAKLPPASSAPFAHPRETSPVAGPRVRPFETPINPNAATPPTPSFRDPPHHLVGGVDPVGYQTEGITTSSCNSAGQPTAEQSRTTPPRRPDLG